MALKIMLHGRLQERGRRGGGFSSVQRDDAGQVKTGGFERSAAPAAAAG